MHKRPKEHMNSPGRRRKPSHDYKAYDIDQVVLEYTSGTIRRNADVVTQSVTPGYMCNKVKKSVHVKGEK